MSKHNRGGGSSGGGIENYLIGLIMAIALVVGVYAILPTFFNSTNSTAVTALNAPTGAQGIFTVLPILGGILFALGMLIFIIKVSTRSRK